jgi:hypothetical protein
MDLDCDIGGIVPQFVRVTMPPMRAKRYRERAELRGNKKVVGQPLSEMLEFAPRGAFCVTAVHSPAGMVMNAHQWLQFQGDYR